MKQRQLYSVQYTCIYMYMLFRHPLCRCVCVFLFAAVHYPTPPLSPPLPTLTTSLPHTHPTLLPPHPHYLTTPHPPHSPSSPPSLPHYPTPTPISPPPNLTTSLPHHPTPFPLSPPPRGCVWRVSSDGSLNTRVEMSVHSPMAHR